MVLEQLRESARLGALLLKKGRRFADKRFSGGTLVTRPEGVTSDSLELNFMRASQRASAAAHAGPGTQPACDLLPGEHADITIDVRAILKNADQWLTTPNVVFGGRAPNELIGTPDERFIRETLRSAIYSGME
jgi:hypothetical protein